MIEEEEKVSHEHKVHVEGNHFVNVESVRKVDSPAYV